MVRSPAGPEHDDLAAHGQRDRRDLGGRIRVRERAAEGAAVADPHVADELNGVRQQRCVRANDLGCREHPVAGVGVDDEVVALDPRVGGRRSG